MTSPICYIDVPVAERGLAWTWQLAWSRHPRDEAEVRRLLALSR